MSVSTSRLIKTLYWDLKDPVGRLNFVMWIVRSIPGNFGFLLRRGVLSNRLMMCGHDLMIHPGVKIRNPHKLTVGNAVHIGEDDFIQAGGGVHIGDNVMLGPGVKIWSQNHDYEGGEAVDDQRYLYAKVIIEDGVWVGANAFIMPGVHLPKGTVVSAGSIVGMKAYPAYSVISGNPARVVARRQGELNASSSTAHKDGNSDQNGRNSPDDQSGHAPSLSKGGEVVTAIGSVQRS